jgi:hypothetical protein
MIGIRPGLPVLRPVVRASAPAPAPRFQGGGTSMGVYEPYTELAEETLPLVQSMKLRVPSASDTVDVDVKDLAARERLQAEILPGNITGFHVLAALNKKTDLKPPHFCNIFLIQPEGAVETAIYDTITVLHERGLLTTVTPDQRVPSAVNGLTPKGKAWLKQAFVQ